jgi:hypothetical protein
MFRERGNNMTLDIEFEEIEQELNMEFEEAYEITDGGFDQGYKVGFEDGYKKDRKEEQEKSVTLTENGTTEILPDENKVLSKVKVDVDVFVPAIEPLTINENGVYEADKAVGGFSPVYVNTPQPKEEQEKSITVTENGSYDVLPDDGKVLSKVGVDVEVVDNRVTEIENAIDESGVLDSTEGSVTEKVEQLIDKAEDGYLAEKMVFKGTVFQNLNSPFKNWTEKTIPKLDFSQLTSLLYTFNSSQIEYIDYYINSSNCNSFASAFANCKNLKWIKGIDFTSAKIITEMFSGSTIERIIEPLDFTNITSKNKWNHAQTLTDFRIVPESYKSSGDFPYANNTAETIQSIFDGLATVETAQTLTLHVNAKILQSQVDNVNAKGWTVAGGTVVSEEEYYG